MATTVAEQTVEILASVAETDVVRREPDVLLFEDGILDSLKTVELILALSRAFDVYISPTEFDREAWATPRKIAAYIEQKMTVAR